MQINVKDILAGELGYRKDFEITDEHPGLPDLNIASGLNGEFDVTRLDEGLLVRGQLEAQLALECHRCLRPFDQAFQIKFGGEYHSGPIRVEGEDWPIAKDFTIDLAPLIRQELILALPIQVLDQPDCPGLCPECGELNEAGHKHKSTTN